jgi:hypothetical protein
MTHSAGTGSRYAVSDGRHSVAVGAVGAERARGAVGAVRDMPTSLRLLVELEKRPRPTPGQANTRGRDESFEGDAQALLCRPITRVRGEDHNDALKSGGHAEVNREMNRPEVIEHSGCTLTSTAFANAEYLATMPRPPRMVSATTRGQNSCPSGSGMIAHHLPTLRRSVRPCSGDSAHSHTPPSVFTSP